MWCLIWICRKFASGFCTIILEFKYLIESDDLKNLFAFHIASMSHHSMCIGWLGSNSYREKKWLSKPAQICCCNRSIDLISTPCVIVKCYREYQSVGIELVQMHFLWIWPVAVLNVLLQCICCCVVSFSISISLSLFFSFSLSLFLSFSYVWSPTIHCTFGTAGAAANGLCARHQNESIEHCGTF